MTLTEARTIQLRTRKIDADRLPVSQRAAEIEALARAKGVTLFVRKLTLEAVAHRSLRGDALWAAWMRVEAAVLLCDGDYGSDRQAAVREKKAAIRALIYGDAADYDGGGAA